MNRNGPDYDLPYNGPGGPLHPSWRAGPDPMMQSVDETRRLMEMEMMRRSAGAAILPYNVPNTHIAPHHMQSMVDSRPLDPRFQNSYGTAQRYGSFPEPAPYNGPSAPVHPQYMAAPGRLDRGYLSESTSLYSHQVRGFDNGPAGIAVDRNPREMRTKPSRFDIPGNIRPKSDNNTTSAMDIAQSRSPSPAGYVVGKSRIDDKRSMNVYGARTSMDPPSDDDEIRTGIIYTNDSYYEFLTYWVERLNDECKRSKDENVRGSIKLVENITKATRAEKERIVLPAGIAASERVNMVHCDYTIIGLPVAVFNGRGYGHKTQIAKNAAAKDVIDKCRKTGVISSTLHAAIGAITKFDRKKYLRQISQAVDAIVAIRKKLGQANLAREVFTARDLSNDTINMFHDLFRNVFVEIYFPGRSAGLVSLPDDLPEIPYGIKRKSHNPSTHETTPVRVPDFAPASSEKHLPSTSEVLDLLASFRSSAKAESEKASRKELEEVLAIKEKEIRERLEKEFEEKKKQWEEEVRKKVIAEERVRIIAEERVRIISEERVRIREEMERERMFEAKLEQQQQHQAKQQDQTDRYVNLGTTSMARFDRQVEDELNRMVEQLEGKLLELRQKGRTAMLEMIFSSSTFKTIATLANNAHTMTIDQKHQLTVDLRTLLAVSTDHVSVAEPPAKFSRDSRDEKRKVDSKSALSSSRMARSRSISPRDKTRSGSHERRARARKSPLKETYAPKSDAEKVVRVPVGNMMLRTLNPIEKKKLVTGVKVIAQDMKTGKWQLAEVVKITGDRVNLNVAGKSWKKDISELFTEDLPMHR